MKVLRRLIAFTAVVAIIIFVFRNPLDRWNKRRMADDPDGHDFLIVSYSGNDLYTLRQGGNIYIVKCGPDLDAMSKETESTTAAFRGSAQLECDETRLFMGQVMTGTIDTSDHVDQIRFTFQSYIAFTIESMRPLNSGAW